MIEMWAWYVAATMEAAKPILTGVKLAGVLYHLGIEMSAFLKDLNK